MIMALKLIAPKKDVEYFILNVARFYIIQAIKTLPSALH